MPTLYTAATALIFPSLHEGGGLPVMEAMACGTPVVASNTSALPEVVGTAGMLLDPNDVQGWTNALTGVLADPDKAHSMSEAGLQQASGFSWDRTAAETLSVLEAVAARKSRKRKSN